MVSVQLSVLRDSAEAVNQVSGKQRFCECDPLGAARNDDQIGKDRFRSHPMPNPRRLGYIRVSTRAQAPDRQIEVLRAECDELYVEHVSAVAAERPVFDKLITDLNPGDTFVVVDLDRAFRSAVDAILISSALCQQGVKFKILSFPLDTTSDEGELFFGIVALFAQFERRIISRRTREGLEAARARGVTLGRRPKLTEQQIRAAYRQLTTLGCKDIANGLGVSRITLQRSFRRLGLHYPIRVRTAAEESTHA